MSAWMMDSLMEPSARVVLRGFLTPMPDFLNADLTLLVRLFLVLNLHPDLVIVLGFNQLNIVLKDIH